MAKMTFNEFIELGADDYVMTKEELDSNEAFERWLDEGVDGEHRCKRGRYNPDGSWKCLDCNEEYPF